MARFGMIFFYLFPSPFVLFIPVVKKPRIIPRRWNSSRRSIQRFFTTGMNRMNGDGKLK